MSLDTAIADIGESLVGLLRTNMSDLIGDPTSIALLSPADVANQAIRLTLFLYHIEENPFLKNKEPVPEKTDELHQGPLYLDLYFMLTTYASTQIPDRTVRTLEEHHIMGRAMRVLHDNPVLSGSLLKGSLQGSAEEFNIFLHRTSQEDLYRIWSTFPNSSYRASIVYLVSSVAIDSATTIGCTRVTKRDI